MYILERVDDNNNLCVILTYFKVSANRGPTLNEGNINSLYIFVPTVYTWQYQRIIWL